jgi:hypothetical protein
VKENQESNPPSGLSIVIILQTHIWEVLVSNLGWDTGLLSEVSCSFPQSLQVNTGIFKFRRIRIIFDPEDGGDMFLRNAS